MEPIIWFCIYIILNFTAILSNLRYLQSERERHRQLVLAHNQLARLQRQDANALDALSANYEQSARYIEAREREMRQKLLGRAEQLIVMRTARGKNGSFEVARLFLTETDMMFLRGRPGLWPSFAEAVRDIGESWFYRTMAGGVT